MLHQLMIKQRTLKQVVKAIGTTVHSNTRAELELCPAAPNTGVIFRVNLNGKITEIPARSEFVSDTRLSTTLARGEIKISTVEHLLSAIAGLGIDNVYINVNAAEVPIMDGSAAPFVFLIQSAGIVEQNVAKRFIRIKKRVAIKEGDKSASLEPYHGFKVTCEIAYDHKVIKRSTQRATLDFSTTAFIKEISRARTFGLLSDYEKIRAMNLALGASLDNAVVVDEDRVLNEGGLRYPNEFVKHKILDAIGDLYLIGGSILGAFEGYKSGHTINDQLLKAVLIDKSAWEYVTLDNEQQTIAAGMMFNSLVAA